ncbi:MAG: VCBS repeat-containing protein, partial [Spirochaetales bacterium]|nr:VCBS repeat-containing protein [Spirochaetales bacterium]
MFLLSTTNRIIFFLLLFIVILSPIYSQQILPDGSFSYTFPLNLPPGIAGIESDLALSYNSNRGNGFCGMGWTLTNLSTITRDSSFPVNFDAADHYLFAGQRLIYSPADGYFHTEKESFLQIAAFTAAESKTGPAADIAYWCVTQKDGKKLYFGYNSSDHTTATDGHIDAVGKGGKALLWALNKVEDVHGNYYTIEYFEDINGSFYPLKIIYTKNVSNPLLKFCTVEFYYEEREEPDHCVTYIPSRVDIDKRLKWIVVKTDDQLYGIAKKYRIDYSEGSSTGRSRIILIEEYQAGGSAPYYGILPYIHQDYSPSSSDYSLPPVNFTYTDGDNSFTGSIWSQAGDWTNNMVGDFNGDGKSDFMQYLGDGDGWRVMLSTGSSFTGSIWTKAGDWTNIMVGDFDGDGKSDFMQYLGDGDGWRVMLSTGSSFTGNIWTKAGDWTNIMVGDFNGDGKSDFIQYLGDGDGWRVMLSTGSSFTGSIWSQAGDWINNMVGDFNGDGKSDLMQYVNNQGWRVYISTGSSFSHSIWSNDELSILNLFHNLVGDFNGDGKSDFIQHVRDQGWRVYISTDSSFTASFWLEEGTGSNWKNNMVADFNGDGKSDLIQYVEGQGWRVLISTGSKFYSTGIIAGDWTNNMVGDFNGNGKSDFLQYLGDGTGWKVLQTQDLSNDKIKTINNGQGARINITYKPAPQVSGAINPIKTIYPYIANSSPRHLVTSVTIDDGIGNESTTRYDYSNAMIVTASERDKRRNIGFEWIKETNETTGSYIKTEFYHKNDNPLLQGLKKRRTVYDTNGKKYIENLYLYDVRREIAAASNYHDVNFIFKKDDYTYHYDGTTIKDTYRVQYAFYDNDGKAESYDDYGNLLQRKNYGDIAVPGDESTVTIEYSIDEENYIMAPRCKTTYAANLEGEWGNAGTVKYYYDHQPYGMITGKGLCTKIEEQAEDGKWITTRYEYDANGRLESIQDPLAIAGGYNTQEFAYFRYDNSRGRYYDSVTNALGMTG